ncbi:MAG TPA: AbrB/MazE/SpoVT family DNA-binding domain-containing protein [Rhizomicrobium sp.]|jgi:AbrB family looped-hinge helix DNA binding protein
MTLVRVRRAAQVTLPAEIRRALHVKDGDYLEAKVVKDGIVLRPVAIKNRERAWKEIEEITSRVRDRNPTGNPEADEEWIAREVKRFRREHR